MWNFIRKLFGIKNKEEAYEDEMERMDQLIDEITDTDPVIISKSAEKLYREREAKRVQLYKNTPKQLPRSQYKPQPSSISRRDSSSDDALMQYNQMNTLGIILANSEDARDQGSSHHHKHCDTPSPDTSTHSTHTHHSHDYGSSSSSDFGSSGSDSGGGSSGGSCD